MNRIRADVPRVSGSMVVKRTVGSVMALNVERSRNCEWKGALFGVIAMGNVYTDWSLGFMELLYVW